MLTVILPEQRGYFVQHLGYFLATFLLLAIIVVAVIVLTRRRKKRGIVALSRSVAFAFHPTVTFMVVAHTVIMASFFLRAGV